MSRAEVAGHLLAERHRREAEPQGSGGLVSFAESPRIDDWTLRSALVRFAQPEPLRAGAVLELVRRTSGALHPLVSAVERHTVRCSPSTTLDHLMALGDDATTTPAEGDHPDGRATEIARLCTDAPDEADAFLRGYRAEAGLEPEEEAALPLLAAAVHLDRLGEVLAAWATSADGDPPVEAVDATCEVVFALLEDLGVPRETGPPGRTRPGR